MFKKVFNKKEVDTFMKKHNKEIGSLYKDKKKMSGFLWKVTNKFNKLIFLKECSALIVEIKTIISILTDWKNGFYTDISPKTVYVLIGTLVYFLMPFDLAFDGIPFLGYVDDMFVASYVFKQFFYEIEKYKLWKKNTLNERTLNIEM